MIYEIEKNALTKLIGKRRPKTVVVTGAAHGIIAV